ncbi:MAG: PPC domain-containing protein, partial [Chloroflexota bacterium]
DGIQAQTLPPSQPYAILVTGNTPPPEQGTRILYYRDTLPIGFRADERGYSSPAEPVFYYTFQGEAGQRLNIVMDTNDIDAALHLYGPDGSRLAVNDDAETIRVLNPTDSAIENFTLPTSGTYLVMATDVLFHQINPAEYSGGYFGVTVTEAE